MWDNHLMQKLINYFKSLFTDKTIIIYSGNWANVATGGEMVAVNDKHAVVTKVVGNAVHLKYIVSK